MENKTTAKIMSKGWKAEYLFSILERYLKSDDELWEQGTDEQEEVIERDLKGFVGEKKSLYNTMNSKITNTHKKQKAQFRNASKNNLDRLQLKTELFKSIRDLLLSFINVSIHSRQFADH
jgi:hypothetical protein